MNFKRHRNTDEPDINLIPMIDVLLVILIFLMVSTTYVKRSALKVSLPQGQSVATEQDAQPITIRISADGQYAMDDQISTLSQSQLKAALASIAEKHRNEKMPPVIRIEADAASSHQTVVTAMDAAAAQGLNRISIVTSQH